jgi:hypothetical protein
MPSQITGGQKLEEPTTVFYDEQEKEVFLADCKFFGVLDDNINAMLECYLNMSEIMNIELFLHVLSAAAARPMPSGSISKLPSKTVKLKLNAQNKLLSTPYFCNTEIFQTIFVHVEIYGN